LKGELDTDRVSFIFLKLDGETFDREDRAQKLLSSRYYCMLAKKKALVRGLGLDAGRGSNEDK
jgi:hypothetical protein